ncbi:MAG: translocation/assembly module TamB domain-containing protein [Deltaproteobacteria bacterium]|nr:translocation/assembly module TamB domain-containing protein [Deltaproteobacteria bacterium]
MPENNTKVKKRPLWVCWLRWLFFSALGFILFIVLIWAGLQTRWAKNRLTDLVASTTAGLDDCRVTLEGLDGRIPFSMVLDRVLLSDAKGAWLEARHVEVSLRPTALLAGSLDVEWFRIKNLSISRLPESTDQPSKKEVVEKDGPPHSLPHVMVRELHIDQVDLGKEVAGVVMAYSLHSKAEIRGQIMEAQVVLQDLHHQDNALHLKVAYKLETRHISTQLTYRESKGGLVAGLMDLKDVQGIALYAKADGPLSSLKGHLDLEVRGYGTAGLGYQVGLGDPIAVTLDGHIRPENRVVPEQLIEVLGGLNLNIEGHAVLSSKKILQVKAFTAKAPSTTISLEGTADLVRGVMDMEAIASSVDISPFLRGSGLEHQAPGPVRLTAKGPFMQPEMAVATTLGALRANRATLEDMRLEVWAKLEKDFKGLTKGRVSLTAKKVQVPQSPALKGPLQVEAGLKSPDFGRWDIETLQLRVPGAEVHVEGARIDMASGDFSADLFARIDCLAALLPPEAGHVDGRLAMRARAKGNTSTRQIEADLNMALANVSGLPAVAVGSIGPDLTVTTRTTLKDDILKLEQAHLIGNHTHLQADGWLNMGKGTFDVRYHLLLKDLSSMAKAMGMQLSGEVDSQGRVAGGFEDFAASMDLSSRQVRVNDLNLKGIHTRLETKGLPHRPSGLLRLKGIALYQPVQLSTGFAWSGETLSLSRAEAGLPGIALNADLEITPGKKHLSGTAQGEITSLELLKAVSGVDAQGSGSYRLKAGEPGHDSGLTLDADFKNLRYKGHQISALKIKAHVDDLTTLRGQVSMDATDIVVQDARLPFLKLDAKGDRDKAVLSLETKGSVVGTAVHGGIADAPISISTKVQMQHDKTWRFRLDRFKALYRELGVTLEHPATITVGDGKMVLDDLQLQTAKGRIQAKAQLNPKTVEVFARVTDLPLALLQTFIDRDLTGLATVKLDLSGSLTDPAVHAGVHIRDHRIPRGEGKPPLILESWLDVRRQGEGLVTDLKLAGLDKVPFSAKASLPARLSLKPFAFDLNKKGDLHARLQGSLDLALLQGVSGMDGQTIGGLVDVDMGVAGTLEGWLLNGGITIREGHYENVALGIILADINGRLKADGRTLRLTRLTAMDGGTGTLALEGDITAEPPFLMDADLTFKQATLLRKEILTSTADGKLDLKGDIKRLDLSGQIILDRTEVVIPKKLPPDVVVIPVTEINLPLGMSAQGTGPRKGSERLFMDLSLQIPARFFVRGRGLDAEFKGQLTAQGPADNSVIRGTLKVVRGTFQFLSRTFHVTNGQIAFDGATPPVPFLNITTQVNAGQINAQVRVTGPANAFSVTLTSEPPLPQDEIMANILFGQSVARLNAFQAYELASSLNQLSGGDMPDFVGETRRLLGVDRLSISGGDNGSGPNSGPSLSAGKYVSESVYVGVEQDLTDAKQDVVVEVDITPKFSVESKAGTKSGAGIGFNWKYDY